MTFMWGDNVCKENNLYVYLCQDREYVLFTRTPLRKSTALLEERVW